MPIAAGKGGLDERADLPRVEILIVTLCEASRGETLRRAIATTLDQERVSPSLVVVVNGTRYDIDLLEELKRMPGVRVLYQTEASIFLARRYARENVTAPYFGFLDDDDCLLPDALHSRIEVLRSDAAADVVVSNGFLHGAEGDSLMLKDVAGLQSDPLGRLMRGNWLATASALFRTATISAGYFDVTIRSNDMTFLAFRLAQERRVVFLDRPTYRKTYSRDSISLTDDWAISSLATLDRMLEFEVAPTVRSALLRKYVVTAHCIADIYRRRGDTRTAWRYHLLSLRTPWGLVRYFCYGRKLMVGSGPGKLDFEKSA
jgi:glycosyltransferase involved in cell wall biosynthesis